MKTSEIREKLHDYISVADEKKVKAIYTIVQADINEEYDPWHDKEFISELEERSTEYKTGKVKGVAWEDVKKKLLKSSRKRK